MSPVQKELAKLRAYLEKKGHLFARSRFKCFHCKQMILVLAQWKEEKCKP